MAANGAPPTPTVVTVPQTVAAAPAEPSREVALSPAAAVAPAPAIDDGAVINPFAGSGSFALAQRMANALASSTVVPKEYQGNVGNCLIAIEIAGRIGMPAFMVMQNMVPIYGKPSWTSKFLIGIVNASPEWTPIRWRWVGTKESGDDWGCRAVATDKRTGEECLGPLVDIAMAKAEGWYSRTSKDGGAASKWPTMPEMMLMYRSAAFWSRMYVPEKTLGLTTEEMEDIGGTIRPGSIDVTHAAPSVPAKSLTEVAAQAKERRESAQASQPAATPPSKPEAAKPVAPSKPEDSISRPPTQERGQATLPVGQPARRGAAPSDENDEDAAARAAVAPTEAEIAANGPPPIASDEDLPPWMR